MVVDHGKPPPVRARAVDPPVRIATIDLAVLVSVADDVLYLKPTQASVAESKLSVVGPYEALDPHGGRAYAGARLDDRVAEAGATELEPATSGVTGAPRLQA